MKSQNPSLISSIRRQLILLWVRTKVHILPQLFGYLAAGGLQLLLWTCRWEVEGVQEFKKLSKKGRLILAVWHHKLLLVPSFAWKAGSFNHYHAVVSASRDGKLFDAFVRHCKLAHVISVPKGNRKHILDAMVSVLNKNEILLITPDGPKGPPQKAKPGICYAAQQTDATIVPFSFTVSSFWKLRSWDRMVIPKPFSTIRMGIGKAFQIHNEDLKQAKDLVEKHLCDFETQL